MIELSELWKKIEDWFDERVLDSWEHCYTTFDTEGNLIHVQSSGRDYCQGAHYLQSGHYSWSGKTKLTWNYENGKGIISFPNGRITTRWSGYLAVILFKTKYTFDSEKGRYRNLWDGKTLPILLFKRSRADKKQKNFFSDSKFVPLDKTNQIAVPEDFIQIAKIYFNGLLGYIKEITVSSNC